ncbi:hypothetical protein [Actinoplanes friuliensis]|uniref:DUF4232 domain-containing protein n=1 Tax=Actinoplanes friuliensis DSM 7358 TaxID=1246995 RepID=U5VXH1_9ACTN|nr:hypothetical protein [Actinoplanes friuliensis]AGZ41668.1 hypothetical protein AFR_16950 [Actinoplanes friuliensis DSM 7358]
MRTTLLMAGVVGLLLSTAACGSTSTEAGELTTATSLLPASSTEYTFVVPDEGADFVDPATGEPPTPCRTGELRITGGDQALIFENITGHACSLHGHPAIGSLTPAGDKTQAILLSPGDRVQAVLRPATKACDPVRVKGLKVSAPEDPATVVVDAPDTCASAVEAFTPIAE